MARVQSPHRSSIGEKREFQESLVRFPTVHKYTLMKEYEKGRPSLLSWPAFLCLVSYAFLEVRLLTGIFSIVMASLEK